MYTSLNPTPCSEHRPPPCSMHLSTSARDKELKEAAYIHADHLLPAHSQLTVFLVSQLQNHVLLSQLMVGLLQVLDVINGFSQNSRLVHLQGIKTYRKQFVLCASRVALAHRGTTTLCITKGTQIEGSRGPSGISKRK